ncbi:MAG: Biotin carboxyl carrier protein of acetyl-CoA carboxylase, partial [uncultured Lysobacter sp.]
GPAQDQKAHRPARGIQPRRDRNQGRRGIRAPGARAEERRFRRGAAGHVCRAGSGAGHADEFAHRVRDRRRQGPVRPARRPHRARPDGRHVLPGPGAGQACVRHRRPGGQGRRHARDHRSDEDVQPDRSRRVGHRAQGAGRKRPADRVRPAAVCYWV